MVEVLVETLDDRLVNWFDIGTLDVWDKCVYVDDIFVSPQDLKRILSGNSVFLTTQNFETVKVKLPYIDVNVIRQWLNEFARPFDPGLGCFQEGMFWSSGKYYYSCGEYVLEIAITKVPWDVPDLQPYAIDFVMHTALDWIFMHRENWIPLCIRQESGKEFAQSKWDQKLKNNKIQKRKCERKIESLEYMEDWRRRARARKVLRHKLRNVFEDKKGFKPESGIEPKVILESLEKLGALYLVNYFDKPIFKGISALLLLLRGSVTCAVYDIVSTMCNESRSIEGTLSDFVTWMKSLVVDIDKFKNNRFAKPFMRFICKFFTTVLCPDLKTKVSKIFDEDSIIMKIFNYFSEDFHPIESVVHLVTYISNAVDVFIKTGELTGFIETQSLDDLLICELREMRDAFQLFKTGDVEFVKEYKIYEFIKRLKKLKDDLTVLRKSRKALDLKEIDNWIREVDSMNREVAIHCIHHDTKMQGYYVSLSSGSGISKGHLMNLIANTIAASNNIPHSSEYHYSLNQANKFQSGWSNATTIVKVDDAAAMLKGSGEFLCLADWLLRGSNNVPHELLGADISEKATLFNRALVEVWTSNSFGMHFEDEARYPSALHRRFRRKIVGRVKPEYTKTVSNGVSSQIDYSKLPLEVRECLAPDAWLFTVYHCEITDSPIRVKTKPGAQDKEKDNDYVFAISTWKDRNLENVSLHVLLDFLIYDSKKHFEQQQNVVRMAKKLNDPTNYCSHGRPKGMPCSVCERKVQKAPKQSVCALRDRIVERNEVKKNHDRVFGPDRVSHYTEKEQEEYVLCNPMYDHVHNTVINEYDKNKMYKAIVSYKCGNYNVTRVCDTEVVRSMPFSEYLLPDCFVKAESGELEPKDVLSNRVRYMKGVLDMIKDRKVDTKPLWHETTSVLEMLGKLRDSLRETLQTWFDVAIIDVLMLLVDKVVAYVKDAMKDPWRHIPTFVEGTMVGAYLHAKRPLTIFTALIDWVDYKRQVAAQWLDNPYAICDIKPEYRLTKAVHSMQWRDLPFIATPTKRDRMRHERRQSKSLSQFVLGAGKVISDEEKIRKESDPCLTRDTFIPALLGCLAVTKFIPTFCKNFSSMYTKAEVGYMVSVDEIAELDKKEAQNWYSKKAEIMKQEVLVDKTIRFSELENLCNKNTVYVKCEENSEFSGGLSPKNQFLILPKHFVETCMGKVIEVTKVAYSTSPGNAMFKMCLTEKNTIHLYGDNSLVFAEKHMDHMRTKDIVDWFPLKPPKETGAGRILYKNNKGEVCWIDLKDIQYDGYLNNEDLQSVFDQPKNPFEGYKYTATTFGGLCGSPIIDHTHKKSCILALHAGARSIDSCGISCFLGREELMHGIAQFENCCVKQESGLTLESYGKELFRPEVYFKNPVFDTVDRIDSVEVLGSVSARTTRKSKVVYTPIYEDVKLKFNLKDDWAAPDFTYEGDKRHGARSLYKTLASKKVLNHPYILEAAVKDYSTRLKEVLDKDKEFWKKDMTLLTDFEIVNGKSVRYVAGMNMSSKFDAHLSGPKSEHAQQVDGRWEFKDYVWKEYHKREDSMKRGVISYELLVNALKNEATKKKSVESGKVRNFFMCGTPFQMILRKYLQTTCRFFCYTTPYSECAVGINPHSTAWDKLFKEVGVFRNYIATDFKSFDLTSLFEILSEAMDILFLPRRHLFEISQEEWNVQKCIKHAILHAICDINGDVMVLKGIIPSGTNITSILGSIMNSLNARMAYYFLKVDSKPFHECVVWRTFSDDSFGSTNHKRFSVRNILYAFDTIGIQATDMHKNKISSVVFYKLSDIEFLKRKGRYDKEFGCIVAPLLDISRFKMLCCHVPTKHMSLEAVTGQCVDNFLLESTFHGRKVYNREIKILREIVKEYNLERFCLTLHLTFEDRLKDWKSKYQDEVLVTDEGEKSSFSFVRLISSVGFWNSKNWFEWTQEFNNKNTCSSVSRTEDVDARPNRVTNQNPSVPNRVGTDEPGVSEFLGFIAESGVDKKEILSFVEKTREQEVQIGGAVPEVREAPGDCTLQQFLSRPVKIAEFVWGSTFFAQSIDPWNLLWNNKRIANRISNYKLFRGKCHVKMVVNGNGFYYGKIMASYLPFQKVDTRTLFSPADGNSKFLMSQCPHVFIDATTSESCTMVLPFFYPADYVGLQDVDTTRSLGSIGFYEIAGLQHANQDIAVTLNNLSITVYAWFENVELVGPTHVNIQGIQAQSGTEKEEVSKPVSQTCTAVANSMHYLAKIPTIGPYALAIEQGARMTATVASALGYSSPLDCVEPNRYQPRIMGNTCVANTTDSAMKLSLDIKQETTVDPSTVGLSGIDELAIQHIASKESLINVFNWSVTQTAGTFLYNYAVTPMMYNPLGVGVTNLISAVCGASIPFKYWNGSLVFKFQVICSANHKGRLAIVYDPNYTASTPESNIAYTEIVDISENREFEITLQNHQPSQWLEISDYWYGVDPVPHKGVPYTQFQSGSNGTLAIYIVNELTSPSSDPLIGSDIKIAAYIRAGDDFQVANPNGRMAGYKGNTGYVPQSGISEVVESNINVDHDLAMKNRQMRVYQGEVIESFRMLLKRYQAYTRIVKSGSSTAYNAWYITHQGFPFIPGYNNGVPNPGENQVGFTYIQYLMGAFSGWKGGFRWKTMIDYPGVNIMMARRDTNTVTGYFDSIDTSASEFNKALEFAKQENESMSFGGVWSNSRQNPVLEIELPFYSRYKFVAGKPRNITECFLNAYTQSFRIMTQKSDASSTAEHSHCLLLAAAEDFTCFFFTGFPPMDCYLVNPT